MRYRLEIKEEARQQLRALPKEQRRNWHQYHARCFLGDRLPLFLQGLHKWRPDFTMPPNPAFSWASA
jgi:mRNA-degrading endonuclease RelE of RelBE toxin-antitoxin system